jgi:hypothetical protein
MQQAQISSIQSNIIRLEAHSTKKQQAHNTIYSNARSNISSISMITAMKMEQTQISSIHKHFWP